MALPGDGPAYMDGHRPFLTAGGHFRGAMERTIYIVDGAPSR